MRQEGAGSMTAERTDPQFDAIAGDYGSQVEAGMVLKGTSHDYFVRYKLRYIAPLLSGTEAPKVLDYGCGVGLLSKAIADSVPSATIHGFDVSGESVAQVDATLRRGANRFTSSLDDLDDDYDLALLVTVLHHVPPGERAEVVQNINSRLRPGGVLAVIEHNMANPLTRKSVASCPFDDDAVMLPVSESVALLRGGGFADVRSRYITFWPSQLSFMQFTDGLLGWLPLGAQYMATGRRA